MQAQLHTILEGLTWWLPEMAVTGLILMLVLAVLLPVPMEKVLKPLMLTGLILVVAVCIYQWRHLHNSEPPCCLYATGMITLSRFTAFWKVLLGAVMVIVVLFPLPYSLKRSRAEYYMLLSGVLLGAFVLAMARHFLLVIIGLELMSLCSYLLAGLARSKGSVESALKYFLFGSAATAIMIYGISWLYGLTGSVALEGAFSQVAGEAAFAGWISPLVITLVSAGILFKVAAAPWHLWVADVYQETPTPIVAMFSVVPKLAGFAFLSRWVDWLGWPIEIVAGLGILTLAVGNFAALRQINVKRMLGYSSIAHSGFLLLALLTPGDYTFLLFYAIVYALMNLGAFLLVNYYERTYRVSTFKEYDGFFSLSAWLGSALIIFMIALTGLPPTSGFTAKLFLFSSVAAGFQQTGSAWLLTALVFGVINAVISFAFYVQLPYRMIFKKMTSSAIVYKKYTSTENFLCIILVVAVLILFFKPEWLMGWINSSSFAF